MGKLISPFMIPIIGFITTSVAVLFMISRLPKDFKETFGPALYLIPIMSGWGIYQFLNWINYINVVATFLFMIIIFACVTALLTLATINNRRYQIRRNIRRAIQMNHFMIGQPVQMTLQTSTQSKYDIHDYYNAPLLQHWDIDGGWKPTPIIPIDKSSLLTKDWVTVDIETPETVRPGDLLIIRVDIINNHPTKTLYDKGILEIVYPNGTIRGYGPDSMSIEPNGELITLYYKWQAPLFLGKYILRYHLFSLRSKIEKVLVVE